MPFLNTHHRFLSMSLLGGALALVSACGEVAPSSAPSPKGSASAPVVRKTSEPITTRAEPAEILQAPEPVPAPAAEPAPVEPRVLAPASEPLPESFDDRMVLGKKLVKEGKLGEALLAFEGALALEEEAAPHVELARVLLLQKDARGARAQAERAVELSPRSSAAWNTLGRVALLEKEYGEAVEHFSRATEENRDNLYAWNNLGLALMRLSRWEEAIAALETATNGEGPESYMWNNLGTAYEHEQRLEEARVAYAHGAGAGSQLASKNLVRLEIASLSVAKAEVETDEGEETPQIN
jgi:tetratricopeptide (TPR) repeat protein